jgi:two-component system, cell cycle response regulator DivK
MVCAAPGPFRRRGAIARFTSPRDRLMPSRSTSKTRRANDADKRRERWKAGETLIRPDEKPVVLVVDDDPDARTIFSVYLRATGCEVFTANDGRTAVEKAIDLLPDLIVMDLLMPRVDGWEAIRRLRESSWTRRIPIICVSAVPVSRETAFEAGCDAYLTKPCEPQVLWAQIRAILKLPEAGPAFT